MIKTYTYDIVSVSAIKFSSEDIPEGMTPDEYAEDLFERCDYWEDAGTLLNCTHVGVIG